MVTLNKPAQNTQDWYQAITDNWTTIEERILDQQITTAKGDLFAAAAPGQIARFGVGADTQVLTADSSQPTGLRWASPNASGQIACSTVRATTSDTTTSGTFVDMNSMSLNLTIT